MNSKMNRKKLIFFSTLVTVIPFMIFTVIGELYGGKWEDVKLFGLLSGLIAVLSVGCIIFLAVAAYRLKGLIKLLPILGSILLLFLAVGTFFNYRLIGA